MSDIPFLTRREDTRAGICTWRFRTDVPGLDFEPCYFDDDWLLTADVLGRQAGAGRGVTRFLSLHGHELVLRRYRRGGLPRLLSRQRFAWTGLERSRPMREFGLLCELERRGLPAPRVFAVELLQKTGGLAYEASLLTFVLPGATLAEHLAAGRLPDTAWTAIGQCIARFHRNGIEHADLNAHNILVDLETTSPRISLIDFDRARQHASEPMGAPTASGSPGRRGWVDANLARLHRSLAKLASRAGADARAARGEQTGHWLAGWQPLCDAHAAGLSLRD